MMQRRLVHVVVLLFLSVLALGFVRDYPGRHRRIARYLLAAAQDPEQQKDALREELIRCCDARLEERVVEIVPQLAALNPTQDPFVNWRARRDLAEATNPLHGLWMVRFTTDAQDSVRVVGRRGPATGLTFVNASAGTLTRSFEFREHGGKIKGFKVVSGGTPLAGSPPRLELQRQRLVVERRSRVGLNTIVLPLLLPLPLPLLPHAARQQQPLELLFVDEEVLVLRSERGLVVHSRLYDVWDPAVGWKLVSAV